MNNVIQVQNLIYEIRGIKVMLDSDLAKLYGVPTKRLNEAVKRNIERFPAHYMFQLTKDEFKNLISQNVTSNLRSQFETSTRSHGGRRYMPYVFTEQGVAMLSSVLNSETAIQVNIQIIDTFVKMRQWAIENKDLARRVSELEHYFIEHAKDYKEDMMEIHQAIDLLMDRTKPAKIGFNTKNE